jgi:hypothetical protein
MVGNDVHEDADAAALRRGERVQAGATPSGLVDDGVVHDVVTVSDPAASIGER